MNLEKELKERFVHLNESEDICRQHKLDDLANHFAEEKDSLLKLQYLMYLALKQQYPEEVIGMAAEMYEKFNFEIKVTKK